MPTATTPKVKATCDEVIVRVALPEWPDRPGTVIAPNFGYERRLLNLVGVKRVDESLVTGQIIVIVECRPGRIPSVIENIEAVVQHHVCTSPSAPDPPPTEIEVQSMTMTDAAPDLSTPSGTSTAVAEALAIIDKGLADTSSRSLVASTEVADILLDLRRLIGGPSAN